MDMPASSNDPFDLLEQLVGQLPAMQAASERLARAQAAGRAGAAAYQHANCAASLRAAERSIERAKAAEAAALASGDADALDHARRDMLFWGQQRGLRVGPEQNARAALDEALTAGGFASTDEAADALLTEQEQRELAEQLAAYQRLYAETLATCEALDENA